MLKDPLFQHFFFPPPKLSPWNIPLFPKNRECAYGTDDHLSGGGGGAREPNGPSLWLGHDQLTIKNIWKATMSWYSRKVTNFSQWLTLEF